MIFPEDLPSVAISSYFLLPQSMIFPDDLPSVAISSYPFDLNP
jgi:hypothetical protein